MKYPHMDLYNISQIEEIRGEGLRFKIGYPYQSHEQRDEP
jgi:hypothetical protein